MNQRDDLGARTPGDWLAFVKQGENWGFPACYGQGGAVCKGVPAPVGVLDPHAAAGGVAILTGQLAGRYRSSALVAEWEDGKVLRVALKRTSTGYRGVGEHVPDRAAESAARRDDRRRLGARRRLGPRDHLPDQLVELTESRYSVVERKSSPGRSTVVGQSGRFGESGKCCVSSATPARRTCELPPVPVSVPSRWLPE